MRDFKTILNDYRAGTPEVRLNLFLFHRDLRCAFNEIEKKESTPLHGNRQGFNHFFKNKKRATFPFVIFKKRVQPAG